MLPKQQSHKLEKKNNKQTKNTNKAKQNKL